MISYPSLSVVTNSSEGCK